MRSPTAPLTVFSLLPAFSIGATDVPAVVAMAVAART
jgi:phosphate/sulfate permease